MLHYISLSFGAFGLMSAADFNAAIPAEAKQYADALRSCATNAWGAFAGFKSGLEGQAASLSDSVLMSVYAAGGTLAVSSDGRLGGPPSIGLGGSPSHRSLACSWPAFLKVAQSREFIIGCVLAPALVCFGLDDNSWRHGD